MTEREPSSQTLTTRRALDLGTESLKKAGVENPRLDMSLIMAHALQTDRLGVYMDLDRPLNEKERQAARTLLSRRLAREPMAYILGEREFFSLKFKVTPSVLIPRPETEHLVERVLAWLEEEGERRPEPLLVDVGTGSGAIAVAAAHACERSRWIATDLSPEALAMARENAQANGVDGRIEFRQGDLLGPVTEKVDAICSNPPYVPEADREGLEPEVARWEPAGALFSGPDGLEHLHRLIEQAAERLRPGGLLLMECGAGQAPGLVETITRHGAYQSADIIPDLAGIGRVVQAVRREDEDVSDYL